jgi:hypothetical protein
MRMAPPRADPPTDLRVRVEEASGGAWGRAQHCALQVQPAGGVGPACLLFQVSPAAWLEIVKIPIRVLKLAQRLGQPVSCTCSASGGAAAGGGGSWVRMN